MDAIAREFKIPLNQVLALFNKAMHHVHLHFNAMLEEKIRNEEPEQVLELPKSLPDKTLEEELEEDAKIIKEKMSEKRTHLMNEMRSNEMKVSRRNILIDLNRRMQMNKQ